MEDKFAHIRQLGGAQYQAFLDAGYKDYFNLDVNLIQKPIYDNGLRLFFISIRLHNWGELVYEVKCDFNVTGSTKPMFSVSLPCTNRLTMAPDEIEAFFRRVYERMECSPYGND